MTNPSNKIAPELKAKILKLQSLEEPPETAAIAKRFGISPSAVSRVAKEKQPPQK